MEKYKEYRCKILISVFVFFALLLFFTMIIYAEDTNENPSAPVMEWDISESSPTDNVKAALVKSANPNAYILEIKGGGRMSDFSMPSSVPWIDYSDKIVSVKFEKAVAYIGENFLAAIQGPVSIYVYNKDITFPVYDISFIPSNASVYCHNTSILFNFCNLYGKACFSLCAFSNSVCLECEYACENHIGGNANCLSGAICETCGAEYTEKTGHSYSDFQNIKLPTCNTEGIKAHYLCTACGKYFDEYNKPIDSVAIAKLAHDYGEFTASLNPDCEKSGIAGHYKCSLCECLFDENKNEIFDIYLSAKGHSGGSATCLNAAICTVCGKAYGENNPNAHSFSPELKYTDEEHFYECECGEYEGREEHTFENIVLQEATEDSEGLLSHACTCGCNLTEIIPKKESSPPKNNENPRTPFDAVGIVIIISITAALTAIILIILKIIKRK